MTPEEKIADLEARFAVLESNLQALQQQINDMPATVQKQLRQAASRRL